MTSFSQSEARLILIATASVVAGRLFGGQLYDGIVAPAAMETLGLGGFVEWKDAIHFSTQFSLSVAVAFTLLWLTRARS